MTGTAKGRAAREGVMCRKTKHKRRVSLIAMTTVTLTHADG